MNDTVPEKLGKYEIRKQIGRGSMGVVYQGYDPFSDSLVAVKVARSEALKNPEAGARYRRMFFNEAHTAGKLKHPNIIEILDAGADGECCYIVMELVEGGKTLKSYCSADNLLPYEQVVEIIFKCAKALDYAHREGVIHRDIKPSNILINRDMDVKIGNVYAPVFDADGEIVVLQALQAHQGDTGGKDPGGFSVDAMEIYEEGARKYRKAMRELLDISTSPSQILSLETKNASFPIQGSWPCIL